MLMSLSREDLMFVFYVMSVLLNNQFALISRNIYFLGVKASVVISVNKRKLKLNYILFFIYVG